MLTLEYTPRSEPDEWVTEKLKDSQEQLPVDVNIILPEDLSAMKKSLVNQAVDWRCDFSQLVVVAHELKTYDEIMNYLSRKDSVEQLVDDLLVLLRESVRRRVEVMPSYSRNFTSLYSEGQKSCGHVKIGLLFSGGLDSSVLAAVAHNYIEPNESIDLINVAFKKQSGSKRFFYSGLEK